MIDTSVDNLAAIQQHVISIKNEEGYYHGEFIPSRKTDAYAIDKFPNGLDRIGDLSFNALKAENVIHYIITWFSLLPCLILFVITQ